VTYETDGRTDSRTLVYHNTSRLTDGRIKMDHTVTISLTIITEHRQNIWYCRDPCLWGLFEMDLSFQMFQ